MSLQNLHEFDKFWPKHLKFSKLFILMCSFWAKYILFERQKVQRTDKNEEVYKIWGGIDSSFPNWHKEFDKFWPESSKVSKIFTLMGSLWANYIFFELIKYRGVVFHETEERYKIWREIDSSYQNWHKDFDKIWSEHVKSQKFSFFWAPFE